MKIITITGMSRSGNHALINWMSAHFQQSGYDVFFINNTVIHFLEHLNFIFPHVNKDTNKVLFVSFEDVLFFDVFRDLLKVSYKNFILLRDPLNLFASRIAGLDYPRGKLKLPPDATYNHMNEYINMYFNHYEEFMGETSFVPNKSCIKYNDWVKSEEYRKRIIEKELNLRFTDVMYDLRAGSSFGEARPETEDYEKRWELCWDEKMYEPIKSNKRLLGVSKELFFINPLTKSLSLI